MGKSLLIAVPNDTLSSGNETNIFGYNVDSSTEAPTQLSCTEAATFSALGIRVTAGNSGTLTLRFRDAGADGNQVVSFASTGSGEDTTNSDVLAASDLFNLAYTDTGTNSTVGWIKGNVELSSGHGNFHANANYSGTVFDAASATRFIGLGGLLGIDGETTEDNVEWKTRAYDSFEALQVRVTANARTNNSIFKNRINGGDGGGSITFAASETGLKTVTGLGDAIADGQTINVSITLDTGLEDLTVVFVGATLKSTSSKSDIFCMTEAGLGRASSATPNYECIGGRLTQGTDETLKRIKVGFAATVSNLRCYLSLNTSASNATLKLYQNGSAVLTTTITASGGAGWYENTSNTITIDADDELSFEFDEGGASGSITIRSVGITFAPVAGPSAEGVLYGPRNYTDGLTSFWSR